MRVLPVRSKADFLMGGKQLFFLDELSIEGDCERNGKWITIAGAQIKVK